MNKVHLLPLAYSQTEKALKSKGDAAPNKLIRYSVKLEEKVPQQIPVFSRRQNEKLIESIILSNHKTVARIIDSYFDQIQALHVVDLDEVKNTIINLTVYINLHYIRTPEMMQLIFNRIVHPAKEVWDMETTGEIYDWLTPDAPIQTRNRKDLLRISHGVPHLPCRHLAAKQKL